MTKLIAIPVIAALLAVAGFITHARAHDAKFQHDVEQKLHRAPQPKVTDHSDLELK